MKPVTDIDVLNAINGHQPRHHEFRSGPTFFRSGKRWWRDDGHGNQTEATDVGSKEAENWHLLHDAPRTAEQLNNLGRYGIRKEDE